MDSFQYHSTTTNIYFVLADITDLKVDVIINFVTRNLSYQSRLNDAIMEKGGKTVEQLLKHKWNISRASYFTIIITPGGNLPCKKIMHTVLIDEKPSNQGYFDAIKEKFSMCLEKAEQEQFQSVAFPIIYPNSIEHVFCKSLDTVLSSYKQVIPKEIYFVCKEKSKFEMLRSKLGSKVSSIPRPRIFYDGPSQRQNLGATSSAFSETSFERDRFQNNLSKTSPEHETMWQAEAAAAEPTPMEIETADPTDSNDSCPICLCDFTNRETLKKCGHSFCSACIKQSFDSVGPSCPICQTVYGKVIGLQPPGTMTVYKEGYSLPGFPNCEMYVLNYKIPSGVQEKNHPNPGNRYHGTKREAYLPANHEGETVLKMLQKAFQQKLIFTVGTSRTTNKSDSVTWNDIHHKTSITGGAFNFGYPDDNYLNRVMAELEAKGIDAKSVADEKIMNFLVS